jgi:hypothetical protein
VIDLTTLKIARPATVTRLPKPTLAQKAVNFAGAAARHIAAGRPQCTDEQVEERFAICQGCELYEAKNDSQGTCNHPSCGCSLKRVGVNGKNKLRWADQACPLGKWTAVIIQPIDPTQEPNQ